MMVAWDNGNGREWMMCMNMTGENLAHVAEVLMDQGYCYSAIPRCARHSLEGIRSNITGHKNAWDTCFQIKRISIHAPTLWPV